MKFGVNTFLWTDHFGREQIPLLSKIEDAGFDGLEIPLFGPKDYHDAEVKQALLKSPLERTLCSVIPNDLSIVGEDAAIRQRTRDHLKACVEAGAEIGAKLIAGPLYSPVGFLPGRRRTEDEWKRAVECFRELGPWLDKHDITVAIEPLNRYETYFLNTAADAAALCGQINHPKVGVLFDTYHANIEEKHTADAIRQVGVHLLHFHSCENDRGIPGTGHVDWPSVFGALRDIRYDRWLTIESFGFSMGALSAAASIWRDLAPSAESIATDGVTFLKKMAAA